MQETTIQQGQVAAGLGASPITTELILQTVFSLLVILLIFGAIVWLLRKSGGLRGGALGVLKILSGISVGSREKVLLIQAGEKQILIGVAPGRISTLHVFDQALVTASTAESPSPQGEFKQFLARFHRLGKDGPESNPTATSAREGSNRG